MSGVRGRGTRCEREEQRRESEALEPGEQKRGRETRCEREASELEHIRSRGNHVCERKEQRRESDT